MKQFLLIVAMVCSTTLANANETLDLDEYILQCISQLQLTSVYDHLSRI